jgi:hypothetical protein
MDNCVGENKNRTVIAFCGMLVQKNIYQSVTLSFLIPGHTHEDIDQMFSTWSQHYYSKSLFTLEHIPHFIQTAYTDINKRPTSTQLSWLYNFSILENTLNRMEHFTNQR